MRTLHLTLRRGVSGEVSFASPWAIRAVSATAVPDPVLSAEELAAMLKINPQTVREMARNRELPAIRLSRHWRFRRSSIEAWLAERERGAR
jgi:excisionase family DNA binding protein